MWPLPNLFLRSDGFQTSNRNSSIVQEPSSSSIIFRLATRKCFRAGPYTMVEQIYSHQRSSTWAMAFLDVYVIRFFSSLCNRTHVQFTVRRYTISISKTAGGTIDCSWVPAWLLDHIDNLNISPCSAIDNVVRRRAAPSPLSDTATSLLQLLIRAAPNLWVVSCIFLGLLIFCSIRSMQAGSDGEIHHVRGARGYYTDFGKKPLGGGLELWQGLFQFV